MVVKFAELISSRELSLLLRSIVYILFTITQAKVNGHHRALFFQGSWNEFFHGHELRIIFSSTFFSSFHIIYI